MEIIEAGDMGSAVCGKSKHLFGAEGRGMGTLRVGLPGNRTEDLQVSDVGLCNFVWCCGCWDLRLWARRDLIGGSLGPRFGAWFVYTCRVAAINSHGKGKSFSCGRLSLM